MYTSKIREVRIKNGLTQRKMAKLIGVSINTYVNWESESSEPSEINRYKIEQAFKKLKEK
jgi:DNA-binding XRE family transcriptional regulator